MVYIMEIKVDGGCRRNGRPDAIGAAAAIFFRSDGQPSARWSIRLPSDTHPTNQRAEITAIIVALEQALAKYEGLRTRPTLDVTIMSDSRYAIGCMNEWIYLWIENGWVNSRGREVANRDLIERASDLDDELKRLGRVRYEFIGREENEIADGLCNKVMDEMEDEDDEDDEDEDDEDEY